MKQIDVSIDNSAINQLKMLIGKQFICYTSDPFCCSPTVYGIYGISCIKIDDIWLAFTNLFESLDYYGEDEDVAVFKLLHISEQDIDSYINNKDVNRLITPINLNITSIDIVNENQKVYRSDKQIYDVWVTRGIIFLLEDGSEISFEKDIWFSDLIIIRQGKELIRKFVSADDFSKDWEDDCRGIAIRNVITLQA